MMKLDTRGDGALLSEGAKSNESRRDLSCFVLQLSEL